MSILKRIRDVIAANTNALLDSVEDPEIQANQCLRDAEDMYSKYQGEYAKAVADQLLAKQHLAAVKADVTKWAEYADRAVAQSARETDPDKKQKLEDLAREALSKKGEAAARIPALEQAVAQHDSTVKDLQKTGEDLRHHIESLRAKADDLRTRHTAAKAKQTAGEVAKQLDPEAISSTMGRLERKVAREEALAGATLAAAQQSTSSKFSELDEAVRSSAVEDELAALKAKHAAPSAPAAQ